MKAFDVRLYHPDVELERDGMPSDEEEPLTGADGLTHEQTLIIDLLHNAGVVHAVVTRHNPEEGNE